MSAVGSAFLIVIYDVVLVSGFLSLQSPQQPIGDPLFSILEILIILMMPLLIGLMVATHAWASAEAKVFSLMALMFMGLVAGLTCSLHFVILVVSRQAAFANIEWMPLFLSFNWPSIPYALDILAWDVFFALAVLCAAPIFIGDRLAASIRILLIVSGVLSLAGLSGVVFGDMRWRNIGVIGYAGVFPIAALLLAVLFYKETPRKA
jgi:cytochrome c oxidase subunit IV